MSSNSWHKEACTHPVSVGDRRTSYQSPLLAMTGNVSPDLYTPATAYAGPGPLRITISAAPSRRTLRIDCGRAPYGAAAGAAVVRDESVATVGGGATGSGRISGSGGTASAWGSSTTSSCATATRAVVPAATAAHAKRRSARPRVHDVDFPVRRRFIASSLSSAACSTRGRGGRPSP